MFLSTFIFLSILMFKSSIFYLTIDLVGCVGIAVCYIHKIATCFYLYNCNHRSIYLYVYIIYILSIYWPCRLCRYSCLLYTLDRYTCLYLPLSFYLNNCNHRSIYLYVYIIYILSIYWPCRLCRYSCLLYTLDCYMFLSTFIFLSILMLK